MGEWKDCKLGDCIDLINGFAFKSANYLINEKENSFPIVRIKNVANGDVNLQDTVFYTYDNSLSKYIISQNDILIAMTGNHPDAKTQVVGSVSKYKLKKRALLNQRVGKLIPRKGTNIDYIYYLLKDKSIQDILSFNSSGSANQANLSKSDILGVEIIIPSILEQNKIVSILSILDSKIDLLHHQNTTLEKMAETIFRQWFIEEAKEDWEEKKLSEIIELVGGGTPKTAIIEYWNGNIKWLSGGDIANNHKTIITNSEKSITQAGLTNSSAKLLPKYSTVISARGTVGKYCILAEPMAFSQSNYGILPRYPNCFFFTYLVINHSVNLLQSSVYGSVFDTITTKTFKEHSISIPKDEVIIYKFEERVACFFKKIESNQQQIQILTQLRDTLLPKLMSGEIKVTD